VIVSGADEGSAVRSRSNNVTVRPEDVSAEEARGRSAAITVRPSEPAQVSDESVRVRSKTVYERPKGEEPPAPVSKSADIPVSESPKAPEAPAKAPEVPKDVPPSDPKPNEGGGNV